MNEFHTSTSIFYSIIWAILWHLDTGRDGGSNEERGGQGQRWLCFVSTVPEHYEIMLRKQSDSYKGNLNKQQSGKESPSSRGTLKFVQNNQ